jgi:paraquat-inducible protein B
MWLATAVCVVMAGVFVFSQIWEQGSIIQVSFKQGHGLKPGDRLRYRGIDVGEVERVEIRPELEGIRVYVRLDSAAEDLAREGSQFWIVRPQLRLNQLAGLETVVGAKYLAVQPGPSDGPRRLEFAGVEMPLALVDEETTQIDVYFRQGYGLSVGDPVRFRGIGVGEVVNIELDNSLQRVKVTARLFQHPSPFARPGTQYWIERPQLTVTEVRGLDTLVGGQYLAVQPGSAESPEILSFEGLEQSPVGLLPEGGLEVVLEGDRRHGLRVGVPIEYRGVVIGQIVSVGLAGDATHVEARAWIEPAYRSLVCEQTRFWNQSGFDLSIGLTGIKLDAEALSSIAMGSIGMATPEKDPGQTVHTGFRFTFYPKPEDSWLKWSPRIAVGSHLLPPGVALPDPQRASVSWQIRRLGFRSNRQRLGWVLWLDQNRLLGPKELFQPEPAAIEGMGLEVAGLQYSLPDLPLESHGELSVLEMPETPTKIKPFPISRLRAPTEPEDVLLFVPGIDPFPIVASRLTQADGQWLLAPSIPVPPDKQGALLIAVKDGAVIGMVSVIEDQVQLALIQEAWLAKPQETPTP